jgi:hypothetical protein
MAGATFRDNRLMSGLQANTRKTECGAGELLTDLAVRAAPFALRWPRNLAAAVILCVVALGQTPRPGGNSLELEPSLFVQLPGGKSMPGAVQLVWIPAPLEKYCLGKTHEQCAGMDFCIRSTTKNVSTCRNLAVDLAHLPAYPSDMRPRRMLSITLYLARMKGWKELQDYLSRAPQDRLEHFSPPGANQG